MKKTMVTEKQLKMVKFVNKYLTSDMQKIDIETIEPKDLYHEINIRYPKAYINYLIKNHKKIDKRDILRLRDICRDESSKEFLDNISALYNITLDNDDINEEDYLEFEGIYAYHRISKK